MRIRKRMAANRIRRSRLRRKFIQKQDLTYRLSKMIDQELQELDKSKLDRNWDDDVLVNLREKYKV